MTQKLDEAIKKFEKRQLVFTVLGLIVLILVSIIVNRIELSSVADESAKFVSDLIQYSDFREINLTLDQARRDYFSEIHYIASEPSRSFYLPPIAGVDSHKNLLDWIMNEKITVPVVNPLNTDHVNHIVYVYNRFRFVPFAGLIWMLLVLVSIPQTRLMKSKIIEQWEREISLQQDRAQAIVAKEVRHNLRSPLAALMRIPKRLPDSVKRDRELLQSTIEQIKALIAKLGHGSNGNSSNGQEPSIGATVGSSNEIYDTLIEAAHEASAVLPSGIQFIREIDDAIVSAHIDHIPHELRAALGNIIVNATEAIDGTGTVIFSARDMGDEIEIEIQDNGRGIPFEIIDRIFDENFTYGKSSGTGTGLFHAKRWIEEWGGTILATSKQGELTSITVRLPVDSRAKWYVPRILLSPDQPIFVVEDQEPARRLWEMRFDEAGVEHARICASVDELRAAIRGLNSSAKAMAGEPAVGDSSALVNGSLADATSATVTDSTEPALFFDYDLGPGPTGIDLFNEINFAAEKYLVTGHFDDPTIRARCEAANCYLVPKSQLSDLPIVVG